MRVFKNKWFVRFARKENIKDKQLCEAIGRADKGLIDAALASALLSNGFPVLVKGDLADIAQLSPTGQNREHFSFTDLRKMNATILMPWNCPVSESWHE